MCQRVCRTRQIIFEKEPFTFHIVAPKSASARSSDPLVLDLCCVWYRPLDCGFEACLPAIQANGLESLETGPRTVLDRTPRAVFIACATPFTDAGASCVSATTFRKVSTFLVHERLPGGLPTHKQCDLHRHSNSTQDIHVSDSRTAYTNASAD